MGPPVGLLSEVEMLDLFNNGDRLIKEVFLTLEVLIGERFVLNRAELFSERCLLAGSFWDLKKSRAGVVAFFLEEEKPFSEG